MVWKVVDKTKIFLEMIRFEHTIFALPFAYIGVLLVDRQIPNGHNILWITMAMVGARTAAMSLNRLIDRHLDALNPRTATRALPKGLLSTLEVWIFILLSIGLLLLAAYQLTPLAFILSPGAVLALFIYSYAKRFTWTCHLFLGFTLGLAPLGAWIAVSGSVHWAPVLLGLGVMFWVAGFDIIYACDDYDFDRRHRVFSIPARFGVAKGLLLARGFHLVAPLLFLTVGLFLHLGLFYYVGLSIALGLLYAQHRLVKPDDLSKAGVAFFNLNGLLSIVMLVFTLLDTLGS